MHRIILALLLLLLTCVAAQAASLEVDLNDFSVQGQYLQPITEDDYGTSLFDIRALYNDHQDMTLISGGFNFLGKPGNVPGLDLGVGLDFYAGQTTHEPMDRDLVALALGGRATFRPPALQGFGFGAKLFYAPEILSFADAEGLVEGALRLEYALTPKIRLFAEYQEIRADFDLTGSHTVDEGLRGGFQAQF